MAGKRKPPAYNPFGNGSAEEDVETPAAPTIQEVDEAMYGKVNLAGVGQQVAKAIPLEQIAPDPAQPRQAVPVSVRRAARQDNIPEWQAWHRIAERSNGSKIDLHMLLRGEGEVRTLQRIETEDDAAQSNQSSGIPLVDDFIELVSLGASIYRDGLANAITVSARGERYEIETGERRYQAYKMLYGVLNDPKFSKINARVVTKADVWRQAAENGSRKPLNAIGMSRQLALLIMDLHRGTDGADFVPYGKMVMEGDIDRKFYAQVADGNIWRIPKGQSERILQVTGLGSAVRLHQYRNLLNLTDEKWVEGDEKNLKEWDLRPFVPIRNPRNTLTGVNVSPQSVNPAQTPTLQKASPFSSGRPPLNETVVKKMRYFGKTVGYIRMNEDGTARIQFYDTNGDPTFKRDVPPDELKELDIPPAPSPFTKETPATISTDIKMRAGLISPATAPVPKIVVGQTYRHRTGSRLYEVVGWQGGDSVRCYEVNTGGKRLTPAPFDMKIDNLMELAPSPENDAAMAVILGDDLPQETTSPDIYQHRVTHKLYRVVGTIPGNWARVVEVDADGEQITGAIEALPMNDLMPYERVVRQTPPETDEEFDPVEADDQDAEAAAIDDNELPEWAATGKAVQHRDTGKICDVLGTIWNPQDEQWWIKASIRNEDGPPAEAALAEFDPYIDVPRQRHPALHPASMSGVIVQEQHLLGIMQELARRMKMPNEESAIRELQAGTAQGIKSRLRVSNREKVLDWIDAGHAAVLSVLKTMAGHNDTIRANFSHVLADWDDELNQGGS